MEIDAYRVARAADCLKAAFAVAVGMNLAEAVRDPNGTVWRVARSSAGIAFTLALAAYVVLGVLPWRRARGERP
ncbi:hypothetical protein ACIP39_16255 [Streptomyces tibetensis]|uniref:hypothetical protein n=1 Tax=Streptomyces tibetensis TaxID=2382123 RepID=UPI00381DB24D